MNHASIVPLIGGMSLAQQEVTGQAPDFLLSYTPFFPNDRHLLNYYQNEVPYLVLDKGEKHPHWVPIVNSTCPCAGLSALSPTSSSDSAINDWMYTTAEYVLGEMKPDCYWGENAPALATGKGEGVRNKLLDIARKHGYSFSVYKTKSLLHGTPQVRNRAFFFFWKGNRTRILNFEAAEIESIEDRLIAGGSNFQTEPVNPETPSKNPYYRYALEEIHGGISHRAFHDLQAGTVDILSYIEENEGFEKLITWLDREGYEKAAAKSRKRKAKRDQGLNYWNYELAVPKHHIGALINPYLYTMTHPTEDRFLSYRDCMAIMTMPRDFELLDPSKSLNHVCQNVPVRTAKFFAGEVESALGESRPKGTSDYALQFNGPNEVIQTSQGSNLEVVF
jgi:site-specific DNA-cytosine methylase